METRKIACGPMSLADYMKLCCTGKLPAQVQELLRRCNDDPTLRAILCAAEILGALEPVSVTRPQACDQVIHYQRQITVPVAEAADTPTQVVVASFCSPQNRALVIEKSRLSPANATAAAQPVAQPVMENAKLSPFDALCLPFEPPESAGAFVNVEHLILPAGGVGFKLYAQNWSTTSEAIYDYEARMWASC